MSAVAEIQDQVKRLAIPGYGDDEVAFIVETLDLVKPTHIFEWGTNYGSSARIFWETKEALGLACLIHTTELPVILAAISPEHAGANTGVVFHGIDEIIRHEGDGVTESLIAYRLAHESVEWPRALFFLDGDHTEENVLRELRWINAVAPNAAILMHDTNPGVRPNFGPHHALVRFIEGDASYSVAMLNSAAGMARLLP